jgi:hypothetical protein
MNRLYAFWLEVWFWAITWTLVFFTALGLLVLASGCNLQPQQQPPAPGPNIIVPVPTPPPPKVIPVPVPVPPRPCPPRRP